MNKEELRLSSCCKLIKYNYYNPDIIYLECNSFQNDIKIEKEDAVKIIEFLKKSFKL